jgi:hypothetical protein
MQAPRFLKDNFKKIEIDNLERIIKEKNENFTKEFIFHGFGSFLPLTILIPGLNDIEMEDINEKCITEDNVDIFYRTVNLGLFWLFIGIIYYKNEDKIYVFTAKSLVFFFFLEGVHSGQEILT